MLFFSRSTPNLAMVIPAMDYIDEAFTTGILQKTTLDPAIRAAVGLAKKTLNRYYSLMDSSELYCIVMGKWMLCNIYFFLSSNNSIHSFTPLSQTRIFPKCKVDK